MENVKRKDRPGPRARLARAAALACAALVALLAGCAQGSGDPGEPRVVVYAAGSYSEGGWDLPCYWRDGTRVPLPFDAEDQAGRVAAIAVDGGTVYTAGSTGYHDYYSCYWKGTERSDLAGRGAEAIAVSGGIVYTIVNGDWSGGGITAFGGAYYTGAALNHLAGIANTDPSRPVWDTSAYGMAVAGGIVYTAGRASGSDEGYACYWTGADARTDLDAASEAKAIYVSGGTVYTAGWTVDGKVCVPCYWAGAAMTKLPIVADNEGYAEDIEVVDGSVYTAGYYGYYDADTYNYVHTACYWIGGERYDLPGDGTNTAQAHAISVYDGVVYVAGCYNDGSKDIPCYWKDGIRTDLPGGSSDGYANDILIIEK